MFSFIETRFFTRLVQQYLSDDQYAELQKALIENPELAPVIAGTGVRRPNGIIWMLTMHPKNVAGSIPAHVLREIREALGDE